MVASSRQSRRDVLKLTALGAAGTLLGPAAARAPPKSLTMMHESSFIKPLRRLLREDARARVREGSPASRSATRRSAWAACSPGSPRSARPSPAPRSSAHRPQLGLTCSTTSLRRRQRHRGRDRQEDRRLARQHLQDAVVVNKKWKAHPVRQHRPARGYRTDWFKEAGVNKFPDTWDDLLAAGIKLKKKGHPFGFELGHGFGDNHGWLYPLLWSYGGREVDKDGKTVAHRLRRDRAGGRLLPQVLQGDDARGRAWAGPTSTTTRRSSASRSPAPTTPTSILSSAKRDFPEIAKVTDHGAEPARAPRAASTC